ncbi:MAG: response regulator [Bacteroidetes bacterium]|nr:response regulator [Bacteroidota bacterium]
MFNKKKSGAEPFKERVSKHLRTADELVKLKKYDGALLEIEAAFELDPKNMYIRSFLERTRYLIQKENEKRSKEFGEVDMPLERRMQTVSRLLASAEEFIKVKLYHRALAVVARVYQIDPKNHYAQLYSERIEELMRAEAAGKGDIEFKPIKEQEPEQETADEVQAGENIQETPASQDFVLKDTPEQLIPMQDAAYQPAAPEDVSAHVAPKKEKAAAPMQKSEPQAQAGRFALYRELLRECWADGVITPEESAMLHRVRTQSSISFEDHCRLEVDIKIDAYVDALQIVWRDGVVTDNEQEVLDIMRKKFGITPEDQAAAEKRYSLLRAAHETKETVLIVDSDQDDLISVARALIGRGYDVRVARHPDEAIQFLNNTKLDLVLSEVVFPQIDTDGFEFYEKVRSNKQWNHIPFLMMTYPGDARIVRAGLRMGVDYFLPKPLHIDFMVAIIEGKLKSGR